MIKGIRIINYESHRNTKLVFEPGLNVFVGESDRGKSGTFRAFNWVRTNRPLGDGISPLYWEGYPEVTAEIENGLKITRSKGKQNIFRLEGPEGTMFEGNAGTDVPESIQSTFDMSEVNYQSQIDRAFLMFDTPGERGRILNQISGLDKIDSTLSAANSDILRLKKNIEQLEETKQQLEEDLEKFSKVPELQQLVEQGEVLERMIDQTRSEISKVSKLYLAQSTIQLKLQGIEKPIDMGISLLQMVEESWNGIEELQKQIRRVEGWKARRERLEKKIPQEVLLKEAEELASQVDWYLDQIEEEEKKYHKANNLRQKQILLNSKIAELDDDILELEKSIPEVCPTCGTELKGKKK